MYAPAYPRFAADVPAMNVTIPVIGQVSMKKAATITAAVIVVAIVTVFIVSRIRQKRRVEAYGASEMAKKLEPTVKKLVKAYAKGQRTRLAQYRNKVDQITGVPKSTPWSIKRVDVQRPEHLARVIACIAERRRAGMHEKPYDTCRDIISNKKPGHERY